MSILPLNDVKDLIDANLQLATDYSNAATVEQDKAKASDLRRQSNVFFNIARSMIHVGFPELIDQYRSNTILKEFRC